MKKILFTLFLLTLLLITACSSENVAPDVPSQGSPSDNQENGDEPTTEDQEELFDESTAESDFEQW